MPSNDVMMLIKHYGVSINLVITILYCKFIEKRNLESMGIVKKKIAKSYFLGTGIAVILLCIIFVLSILSGAVVYYGKNDDINIILILAYLGVLLFKGLWKKLCVEDF
ncbi:hypothetical protein JTS98_18150 [Clostridium botulinum]|nr:hypothetical protein [Clostridium botulinum]